MKDLTKQLDRLKEIRPEPSWKENERAVLESRIRSSRISQEADLKERLFSKFIYVVRGLKSRLVRPAWAGIAVLLLVLLGGGAIVQASEDAKPGSLLYYARLAKEKTQIATTFDEREKNKLSLKFAGEHAKDITEVLDEDGSQNQETREELTRNFKNNLESVKMSLKEMNTEEEENNSDQKKDEEKNGKEENSGDKKEEKPATEKENARPEGAENSEESAVDADSRAEESVESAEEEGSEESSSEEFFTVDSGRQEKGMEVYNPDRKDGEDLKGSDSPEKSTSSQVSEKIKTAENLMEEEKYNSEKLNSLVEEAENLFREGEYVGAKEKIEELMSAVASGNLQEEADTEVGDTATSAPAETETSSSTEEENEETEK